LGPVHLTYDLLIYEDQGSRLRPYVAVGAGGKYYHTTGPEPATQPFPQFASLIGNSEWTFVTSLGFGVKYLVRDHLLVRADFRDYITSFPRAVIVPATGATDRGMFHQFTPMIGVSYWF
jgi:opacity protein-like surface antigen